MSTKMTPLTDKIAQDHIEVHDWESQGDMLPTVKAYQDINLAYAQIDKMRDNLQAEYVKKCFAPPSFPFVEVAAGFVLGVCLTLIVWGLV